jgi:predicted Zn-dependent protease
LANIPHWKIEDLKSELGKRTEIKSWVVIQNHTTRRERYFLGQAVEIDQDRASEMLEIHVRMLITKSATKQGELTKSLSQFKDLRSQLDLAVESAKQSDEECWSFYQATPKEITAVRSSDRSISENIDQAMSVMSQKVSQAAHVKHPSTFNSAEVFLSVHQKELHFHHGLIHREEHTRVYVEAAYSSGHQEFLATRWGVALEDIDVHDLFREASLKVGAPKDMEPDQKAPPTGTYAVIIDADAMMEFMGGFAELLSSKRKYLGMPSLSIGDAWVPEAHGDLMSLWLDPTLDHGADTTALSSDGVPQRKIMLVDQNKVVAQTTDAAAATFLKREPTTVRGTLVVAPGTYSYMDLIHAHDQVLEVIQFSGLFSDVNTRTFSSEIRIAKLHDRRTGKTTLVKGGSLSASMELNFKDLKLSKELLKRVSFTDSNHPVGYYGPQYALLSDVSVVS